MNRPNNVDSLKRDILYSKQYSLLERMQIHQRNLEHLLQKAAKYGIDVPVSTKNGIDDEEKNIEIIRKELSQIEQDINRLRTYAPSVEVAQDGQPKLKIHMDGRDYSVEWVYPSLRTVSTIVKNSPFSFIHTFVGGLEIHSKSGLNSLMELSFFRHGKPISPILDHQNAKIVLPSDNAMSVNWFETNIFENMSKEELDKGLTQRKLNDGWRLIAPSESRTNTTTIDSVGGYKSDFWTTHVIYKAGYELWMTRTDNPGFPMNIWLYQHNRNVAPILDWDQRLIYFPGAIQHNKDKDLYEK